jgi:hypothetical protein
MEMINKKRKITKRDTLITFNIIALFFIKIYVVAKNRKNSTSDIPNSETNKTKKLATVYINMGRVILFCFSINFSITLIQFLWLHTSLKHLLDAK